MSSAVHLQTSSSPHVCSSQLNVLKGISSCLHVDHDSIASSAFKQNTFYRSHLVHVQRRKKRFPSFATLKESVEKISSENSIPDAKVGSESLIRNELSALDAYFNKLQGKSKQDMDSHPSDLKPKEFNTDVQVPSETNLPAATTESPSQDDSLRNDLRSIELYLEHLSKGGTAKLPSSPADAQKNLETLIKEIKEIAPSFQPFPVQDIMESQFEPLVDELPSTSTSESLVVYVLAAVNIAVYLFGLASPVDTAGMGTSTLPVIYGAKVNELLLNGEWWRLVTPMFLHSGFFHIALSSWALLFFGPQVENVFGPLAFCMIYFLGGLCGNICSFFFTPDATVGGTGPLFALFSAWVVYLWQNKRALGEQSADYGIKATTLMGVLVLCLSCLLPTDEWIHVGAILPGIFFGSFAAPMLQAGVDVIDSHMKNAVNSGEEFAVFDGPSVLSLSVAFVLSTGLCFTVYNILVALMENSQLLNRMPH